MDLIFDLVSFLVLWYLKGKLHISSIAYVADPSFTRVVAHVSDLMRFKTLSRYGTVPGNMREGYARYSYG